MDQTGENRSSLSQDYKVDVEAVGTPIVQFSPELIVLYEVWHCHDGTTLLSVFFELYLKASTAVYGMIQHSTFLPRF